MTYIRARIRQRRRGLFDCPRCGFPLGSCQCTGDDD